LDAADDDAACVSGPTVIFNSFASANGRRTLAVVNRALGAGL
jgi:hypothetical protein